MATDHGITVYNLCQSAQGAMDLTQEPELQQAQRDSGLPAPSSGVAHRRKADLRLEVARRVARRLRGALDQPIGANQPRV